MTTCIIFPTLAADGRSIGGRECAVILTDVVVVSHPHAFPVGSGSGKQREGRA